MPSAHLTVTTTNSGFVASTRYMLKPDDPKQIEKNDIIIIRDHKFFVKEYDGIRASINPVGEPKKKFKSSKVEFEREFESSNQ